MTAIDTNRIPGWGADLDPAKRPAVPKEKPSNVMNVRGDVELPRQEPPFRIHKSVEHPDLTPVFGTSCPPRGLSGKLRDIGYQFGEGRLARWMTLLLADRIDVVEGVLDDLAHAKVPNTYKERGWTAKGSGKVRLKRDVDIAVVAGIGLAIAAAVMIANREK
ncbi:MAG TPA: hypothetical protein VHK90_01380 [Thermoanaerobaculia bacterium]|nr:hypothetical protein [Thermoanaerobaculia bacterium]